MRKTAEELDSVVSLLACVLLLPTMVDDRPMVRLENNRRPFFVRFTPVELMGTRYACIQACCPESETNLRKMVNSIISRTEQAS